MILRAKIKNVRFVCSIRKVSWVVGVTSKLKDKNNEHILMWDFDKTSLDVITKSLLNIQDQYNLSEIRILESNKEVGNYHAYCFKRYSWQNAVVIVANTYNIDWDFIRLALYRGNFTIRISKKLRNPQPKLVRILKSKIQSDCMPEDLESFVQYEIWTNKEREK